MTAGASSGVGARIQQALDAGKSPEQVARDLVAEGLSKPTAERFVQRALVESSQPRAVAAPAQKETDEAVADPGGRRAMTSGAFWLSLGCTVTAATYLLAAPGDKYTVAYGAAIAGVLAFGQGAKRWWGASQPFPWIAVLLATAVPPVAAAVLVGFGSWREGSQRAARQAVEEQRLKAARAVQDEHRAVAEREAADAARAQRHTERVASAREGLQSGSPTRRCDAALDLGNQGAREAIPDLVATLQRSLEYASIRNCVAGALVQLGEIEQPLAFYVECVRAGTAELSAIGLRGLKEIGPPAAAAGLPQVAEALRSPASYVRVLAVEALEKFGPPGEELLRQAANDSDAGVRKRALQALAATPH